MAVDHAARTITINTDAGRLMVPFIPARFFTDPKEREALQHAIAEAEKMMQSLDTAPAAWDMLIENGFVELYDQVMVDNIVVAHSIEDLQRRPTECTHVQLPCAHCGLIASLSCSVDMTKGARAVYSTSQWKQGIGASIHNPHTFYLGEVNLLQGAQVPLVRSVFNEIMGIDRWPFCINASVIYMAFADNQSDALIFNQAALDRGRFVVQHLEFDTIFPDAPNAAFGVPDFQRVYSPVGSIDAYAKVDPVLGIPTRLGQDFKQNDVIAAITKPLSPADINGLREQQGNRDVVYTLADVSVRNTSDHCPNERHPTPKKLTAFYSSVGENARIKGLQFAVTRFVKPGDKFASLHSQKGICCKTFDEWEIPYNEEGLAADIIFNPPSLIKRETHGQLPFTILGKICAMYGTSLDHTPFLNRVSTDDISGLLTEIGLDPNGLETMYDPTTGHPFANKIMTGSVSYTRSKRMVDDLVQYRYHGPRERFTRAATKGRNRLGGVTFDEMTRNATLSAGATLTSRDCMFTQAAVQECYICDRCNQFAYPSPMTPGVIKCDRCGNLDPAGSHMVLVPYNALLLYSILAGAGCVMEIKTAEACLKQDASKQ